LKKAWLSKGNAFFISAFCKVMKMGKSMCLELSEKEKKLIEFLRNLDYGEIRIVIMNNQPVTIEEMRKSIKL